MAVWKRIAMKRITRFLVVSSGALLLGAFVCSSPASALSISTSAGAGAVTDSDTGSGQVSSAAVVSLNYLARARANSNTLVGSAGVEVRTARETPSNESHQEARANANYDDTWNVCLRAESSVRQRLSGQVAITFTIDGIIDPLMVDRTLPVDQTSVDLRFGYQGFNQNFSFVAVYDAGFGRSPTARLNGADVSSGLIYGTNALGDTTVSYSYTTLINPFLGSFNTDSINASATIGNFNALPQSPHTLNFLSTFSVGVVSLDPNILLVSEGGRRSLPPTPSVPEPSTWLLLGSGLAGLAAWRRKQAT